MEMMEPVNRYEINFINSVDERCYSGTGGKDELRITARRFSYEHRG